MLYTDFFLGALGGGLLILGSMITLFYGPGHVNAIPFLTAVATMLVGSTLLFIELGVPFRAWRIFANPRSFIMIGASLMTVSMALGLLLASFYLSGLPWSHLAGVQYILAVLAVFAGLGVAFYPGLLLGSMAGRPFWRGTLLAPLFLLSGLSTGIALLCLFSYVSPVAGDSVYQLIKTINAMLLSAQVIGWITYVFIKKHLASPRETPVVKSIFDGGKKFVFWFGFVGLGLIVPAVFYFLPAMSFSFVTHLLVLAGALIMRGFVVTADKGVSLGF